MCASSASARARAQTRARDQREQIWWVFLLVLVLLLLLVCARARSIDPVCCLCDVCRSEERACVRTCARFSLVRDMINGRPGERNQCARTSNVFH